MNAFELTFAQSLVNCIVSGVLVKMVFRETLFSSVPRRHMGALYLRSFAQSVGFFFLTIGFSYVPLGIFLVVFSSNIFTTAMLAFCWLDERLSKVELYGMFFAFIGVLIIGLSDGEPTSKDGLHDTSSS